MTDQVTQLRYKRSASGSVGMEFNPEPIKFSTRASDMSCYKHEIRAWIGPGAKPRRCVPLTRETRKGNKLVL